MPASVQAANPSTVMPYSLATAFQQSRDYTVDANVYSDGEVQVNAITSTSRKRWAITRKITAAQWTTLLAFYRARKGGTEEFYFYDVFETDPLFTYDDTGTAVEGRYIVRFDGDLSHTLGIILSEISISLVEVA